MRKVSFILGFISLILAIMAFSIMFSYYFGESSGDWSKLGFMLISIIFFFITVLLTIPFLISLFTIKFKNMKLHFFSHIALVLASLIMLMMRFYS